MLCPDCGIDNRTGVRFCEECGARLEARCPACGSAVPLDRKFCGACGEPLAAPAGPSGRAAPDTYTPARLAARILNSRSAIEGERKHVTVLFADLRGSLELLADRDPEEARQLLDPVLTRMIAAVHRYDGLVNQVMGDGIMALFGAPLAHEDHAVRACHAAVDMQEALHRHAAALGPGGDRVKIRIGLNSGEVVVRSIASDLRLDYTAVGQTTHLASRMEQRARPGTILMTAATHRLVQGFMVVERLGPTEVKGFPEPIEVFELIGRNQARSRLDAMRTRALTRFLGREAEIDALARAAQRAAAGNGQVIALVGDPGVGKSRLLYEFTESRLGSDWLALETGGVSYARTASAPIVALLRRYFELSDDAPPEIIGATIERRLRELDELLLDSLTPLRVLLGAPPGDDRWTAHEPSHRQRRIVDAVVRLLVRQARSRPLCIVVEDLQWIDTETHACLDRLVDALHAVPLLLLASYRPEYRHGWSGLRHSGELVVEPLPREAAETLLDEGLGIGADVAAVKTRLLERTDGNPFFLEECVTLLVETGVLQGTPGAYHVARSPAAFEIPATVQSIIAARIDRLRPDDKQLLQAAAAIGPRVPVALLEAILDAGSDAATGSLERLREADFLYPAEPSALDARVFRHALTLDVAYGSLLGEQRRLLDTRIVAALEAMSDRRDPETVERLAHHAARGELWSEALRYSREAGQQAFARSAHRTAVEHFERALAALDHLPRTPATVEAAIDLRLELRYALMPLGEFRRSFEHVQRAGELAQTIEDWRRLGLVCALLTNYFHLIDDTDRAVAEGRRALEIAGKVQDLTVEIVANANLGLTYYTLGDYKAAIEVAQRNVALLRGPLERERFGTASLPAVYSRTCLAWSLAELGRFAESATAATEAVDIATEAAHSYSLIYALLGAGVSRLRQGDLAAAITALERAVMLCQTAEIPLLFATVAAPLVSAYALDRRPDDAFHLLERTRREAAVIGDPVEQRYRDRALAETYLAAGRVEDALPAARRNVEQRRALNMRGHEAWGLRLMGEIAACHDPPLAAEAEAAFRDAERIAAARDMRPLLALCRLGLARLHRREGRPEASRELGDAHEQLRSLEMHLWLAAGEPTPQ